MLGAVSKLNDVAIFFMLFSFISPNFINCTFFYILIIFLVRRQQISRDSSLPRMARASLQVSRRLARRRLATAVMQSAPHSGRHCSLPEQGEPAPGISRIHASVFTETENSLSSFHRRAGLFSRSASRF